MRGRMGERRPPVQVNVDELLREEQTKERERTGQRWINTGLDST